MAGDRAGLTELCDEASGTGHLVVISRLGGWGIMPSTVSASGVIQCCDQSDVRETLCLGIERAEEVCLHIMAWPTAHRSSAADRAPMNLLPPDEGFNQD
ncbi:hypothetical protein QJS04_geneDACA004949 [Acorus gramineus]|uniref:Uncharacterized protein n=1 Tax=Acorus gramineus TaxID=55184 RepID=A0AAV9BW90_ACOGR|nr:hypothetical protein QJS04_geneDACA004949 [Acorus gramineus]